MKFRWHWLCFSVKDRKEPNILNINRNLLSSPSSYYFSLPPSPTNHRIKNSGEVHYQKHGVRSFEAQGTCSVDRLSNLPDETLIHILSFLTIGDLIRLCSVSKRCRECYLSTLSLDFSEFSHANISTCDEWKTLLDCLDWYLVQRGRNKMQCFRFRWPDHHCQNRPSCLQDLNFRTIVWINYAVRCNAEVLHLHISMDFTAPDLVFPCCVFLCGSLRDLYVDRRCTIFETPPSACYSSLEYLKLKHVKIADEAFLKWISQSCKRIQELRLHNVYGVYNVTIESSSLKLFRIVCDDYDNNNYCNLNISGEKLENIRIIWGFRTSHETLNISAPNLRILKRSGRMMKCENLGDLMSLEEAKIGLLPEEKDFDHVCELLWSIRRVKVLVLTGNIMEFLFVNGLTPTRLDDVCNLRIEGVNLLDDDVCAMVSLLKGIPNLSSLYIKASPLHSFNDNSSRFHMQYWKHQSLDFIHQLKEVTIELSNASNGIVFASYILEHAQNLEKMVVRHLPTQSNLLVRALNAKRFNAKLVFQERME